MKIEKKFLFIYNINILYINKPLFQLHIPQNELKQLKQLKQSPRVFTNVFSFCYLDFTIIHIINKLYVI